MQKYEIEIKSLLGNPENAEKLRNGLAQKGFDLGNVKKSSQLNHYFTYSQPDVLEKFKEKAANIISPEKSGEFKKILTDGKDFSIRTREINREKVILVIKASLDSGTSANGVSRIEFEEIVNISLDELDKILLDSGLEYQAKWSREREEYVGSDNYSDITVCLDKNAGYGFLAEFETVTENKEAAGEVKNKLGEFMKEVGCAELQQDRLARMFDFYNKNWANFYGTNKIFNIE